VYANLITLELTGEYGDIHSTGSFSTGGNAGRIRFGDVVPLTHSGAQVYRWLGGAVYLTGIFWIQTVGWAGFPDPVELIPPIGTWANVRNPWTLSGYIWSPNAGWIALNHGEPYASGVYYLPDTRELIGYGWSDSLGWIAFAESGTGVRVGISEGFIGKVWVEWAIWGSKTFNVLYDVWGTFNTVNMTTFLRVVKKNIAFLSRNAGTKINTDLTLTSPVEVNKAILYKIEDNPSDAFLRYSTITNSFDIATPPVRSIITVGADIYINTGVVQNLNVDTSRAIIALKNERWQGGDIYIKWDVKKIYATLFAEGTIYSGEEFISGQLSPYYVRKTSLFTDIPRTQLYVKWGVAGYNTIWWGSKDGWAVCPYAIDTCNYETAIPYDWNYFRLFDGTPGNRAYPDASKDGFSVVIDYDPRVIQDPPPWLETLR
jgi:hypothetical protein